MNFMFIKITCFTCNISNIITLSLYNTDALESNIRIGNRTYILEYSDPNSQEYKLLETEFCEGVSFLGDFSLIHHYQHHHLNLLNFEKTS